MDDPVFGPDLVAPNTESGRWVVSIPDPLELSEITEESNRAFDRGFPALVRPFPAT